MESLLKNFNSLKDLIFMLWGEVVGIRMRIGGEETGPSIRSVFSLMHCLFDRRLSQATIKAYPAAMSSCHEGSGGGPISTPQPPKGLASRGGSEALICGSRLLTWEELLLVLEALRRHTYKPLGHFSLQAHPFKTTMLRALTWDKEVGELNGLLIQPYLFLQGDRSWATLRPSPPVQSYSVGCILSPPPHCAQGGETESALCSLSISMLCWMHSPLQVHGAVVMWVYLSALQMKWTPNKKPANPCRNT